MRSTLRNSGIMLSGTMLALLCACGGGGSSPNGGLTVNAAPTVTTPVVSPADASLLEYKTYTFSTNATDPDLGDSVASCTWSFGDGSDPVTVTTAPFSVQHVFLAPSSSDTVSVVPTDSHGKAGTAATAAFSVTQAPNPFTTSIVSPLTAYSQPVALGSSATVDFLFKVTNSLSASVLASGVTFNPGFTGATGTATVTPGSLDGTTAWKVSFVYPAGTIVGATYTANPTLTIKDTLGVQSLPVAFPAITFSTVVANPTAPTISVTVPSATSTKVYALQDAIIKFTVTDSGTFPTTVTVDWGDSTTPTTYLLTGSDLATGMAPPSVPTHKYQTAGKFTITVSAVDNQATNNTAVPQTRTYEVLTNALPKAVITSPQASGTLPDSTASIQDIQPVGMATQLELPRQKDSKYPQAVVIPLDGKLNFSGTVTNPESGEQVSVLWTFQGGDPSSSTDLNPGNVSFTGVPGKIVAYLVELQAIDVFGRTSSQVGEALTGPVAMAPSQDTVKFRKWVIVDGVHTEQFTLNLMYRELKDDNAPALLTQATLAANGFGANVMIFQDGLSNTYQVASANAASITIPVRSDQPFYVNLPSFNSNDPVSYMMRIPNIPGQDPALEAATPAGSSSFAFVGGNPTLSIVTSQGFAPETTSPIERKLNAVVSGALAPDPIYSNFWMVLGDTPANDRWFDRLSVPKTDPKAIPSAFETSNSSVGLFSGIPANQTFAEWPIYLMSVESDFLPYTFGGPISSTSPTTTPGTSTTLGFRLDHPGYADSSSAQSDTYGAVGMQAFRVPASNEDPYDLTTANPGWNLDSCVSALNPTTLDPGPGSIPEFFSKIIFNTVDTAPGGLQGFVVPYNTNDVNRKIVQPAPQPRLLTSIAKTFSYAEYLWSSVWVRPLVLNNALLYYGDARNAGTLSSYPFFRYSKPAAWPKYVTTPGIVPDNSQFDLTANGGTHFDAMSPVAKNGGTPDSKAVGRFYWTAFTPPYNSASGSVISRTWLADPSGLPPTSFPALAAGDATNAMGLLPPQDTAVDKRYRDANGVVKDDATLGGYRVMWYNPTKDKNGDVVPPDFWVVEVASDTLAGQTKTHFMLPANYPGRTNSNSPLGQETTDPILTDARVYLPSHTLVGGTPLASDVVAPGYCWFDIPPELRPTSDAVITVFALRSVLNNNPTGAFRALNRTDWIDAIKTATATISVVSSSGRQVDYVHKIPFNFGWDIVVVNGEATIVAP